MEESFVTVSRPSKSSKKVVIATIAILLVIGAVCVYTLPESQSSFLKTYAEVADMEFEQFVAKHNKMYASDLEYLARKKIFQDNTAYIRVFNSEGNTFTLGINKFADLTFTEFKNLYLPNRFPEATQDASPAEPMSLEGYPSKIDWRTKGAVTSVKNQGQCGSCWAFSTTEGVEGSWALAGNKLVSLSEQELVDCSTSLGNNGCNGGLMRLGYEYVLKNGLTSNSNYPYNARDGKCDESKVSQKIATIQSYQNVTSNSQDALIAAANQGPVSVAVEADQQAWQFYFGGIVSSHCGYNLDHGVLVVGYNRDNSPPYWIVKNSWGPDWGEDGYIRIHMIDGKGVCGINMQPSVPKS